MACCFCMACSFYGSDGIDDGTIKVDPYTALIYDIELIGVSAE